VAKVISKPSGIHVGPLPKILVKQEEMSFDLHHEAVYEFLEMEANVRIGASNGIVSWVFSFFY
jgi:hypothetical protein